MLRLSRIGAGKARIAKKVQKRNCIFPKLFTFSNFHTHETLFWHETKLESRIHVWESGGTDRWCYRGLGMNPLPRTVSLCIICIALTHISVYLAKTSAIISVVMHNRWGFLRWYIRRSWLARKTPRDLFGRHISSILNYIHIKNI